MGGEGSGVEVDAYSRLGDERLVFAVSANSRLEAYSFKYVVIYCGVLSDLVPMLVF